MSTAAATLDRLLGGLADVGRAPTGGYRRFAWTDVDVDLRTWFEDQARARGMDVVVDRAGNQWAWWGDPDRTPGVVTGSHLDSVPGGGAFDGPLGVVTGFAAVDALRAQGRTPSVPLGVVCFSDEEGGRFGVACLGSRLLTGALEPARALALHDADGVSLADALRRVGRPVDGPGAPAADPEALGRVAAFVELHIEQGRVLDDVVGGGAAVGVGTGIWPHGRWRVQMCGEANHAGTTPLAARQDPMLDLASLVVRSREAAERSGALATVGRVVVEPNGVNAIPSRVTAWLDARAQAPEAVADVLAALADLEPELESWTGATTFDEGLVDRVARVVGRAAGGDAAGRDAAGAGAPRLTTGAGHDAGVLATAGVPTAMLFVRNLTGISHSPAEHAEPADCHAGLTALTAALADLTSAEPDR